METVNTRVLIVVAAYAATTFFVRCVSGDTTGNNVLTKGKTLAAQYCAFCHMLPDPSLLTKEKWNSPVLPVMALYLGMNEKPVDRSGADREAMSILPVQPVMDTADWRLIKEYYTTTAPNLMPPQQRTEPAALGHPFLPNNCRPLLCTEQLLLLLV